MTSRFTYLAPPAATRLSFLLLLHRLSSYVELAEHHHDQYVSAYPLYSLSCARALTGYPHLVSQPRRAILVKGGTSDKADGLYLGETERPTPKQGEVLVQVSSCPFH